MACLDADRHEVLHVDRTGCLATSKAKTVVLVVASAAGWVRLLRRRFVLVGMALACATVDGGRHATAAADMDSLRFPL